MKTLEKSFTRNLTESEVEELAELLDGAERNAADVPMITERYPQMTQEDAYDIQYRIRRRKLERGHSVVGLKMGLTSWAKMRQMGVSDPVYAFLADDFAVPDGGEVYTAGLIHPRVEVELAFMIGKEIRGPGISPTAVLAATDFVTPAVEIIDSRYRDFKFDLNSVIADNASSARFVLGSTMKAPRDLDLKSMGVVLYVNGAVVATGAAAAVLGHPATSVAMLANLLARRGESIPAGTLVMTGGITEAIRVKAGDSVQARIQDLGTVSVRFV